MTGDPGICPVCLTRMSQDGGCWLCHSCGYNPCEDPASGEVQVYLPARPDQDRLDFGELLRGRYRLRTGRLLSSVSGQIYVRFPDGVEVWVRPASMEPQNYICTGRKE